MNISDLLKDSKTNAEDGIEHKMFTIDIDGKPVTIHRWGPIGQVDEQIDSKDEE